MKFGSICPALFATEDGEIYRHGVSQVKPNGNGTGYLYVWHKENGKQRNYLVHRIVASAFCDRQTGATQVNHIDGNKTNNRADNLEWVTPAGNMKHAKAAGLMPSRRETSPKGELAHSSKLSSAQVVEIRERFLRGEGCAPLSREFGGNVGECKEHCFA